MLAIRQRRGHEARRSVSGSLPRLPDPFDTNGGHGVRWPAPSFQALYDRHLPDWRRDTLSLRYAIGIPGAEMWEAHRDAKRALLEHVHGHAARRARADDRVRSARDGLQARHPAVDLARVLRAVEIPYLIADINRRGWGGGADGRPRGPRRRRPR